MSCVCKDKYDSDLSTGDLFILDKSSDDLWDIAEILPENKIRIVLQANSEITKTVNATEGFTVPF